MPKYHFNPKTGERGICKAKPGNCPVCDEQHHFDTEEGVNQYEDGLNSNGIIIFSEIDKYSTEYLIGVLDKYKKDLQFSQRVYKDFAPEVDKIQKDLARARMKMHNAISEAREEVADYMYDKAGETGVRDRLTILDNGAFYYGVKEADKDLLKEKIIKDSNLSDKQKKDLLKLVKQKPDYNFKDEYSYNKIYKNKITKDELESIGIKDDNVLKAVNSKLVRFERVRKDLSQLSKDIDEYDDQMNTIIKDYVTPFSCDSRTIIDSPYLKLNSTLSAIGIRYKEDLNMEDLKYKSVARKMKQTERLERDIERLEVELDNRSQLVH